MTPISKKLAHAVESAISKSPILPIKTDQGILVGNVLIVSDSNLKNLHQYGQVVYTKINLNAVAIKLANLLSKFGKTVDCDKIYLLDQEYGRWLTDSQMLYNQHKLAISKENFERADILWARYRESKIRYEESKQRVNRLCSV
jgi:hypothetical protein